MAFFIKKLVDVRNRSKSPTKQVNTSHNPTFFYGLPPPPPPPNGFFRMDGYQFSNIPSHYRNDQGGINDYSPYPTGLLPLRPSPLTSPGPMMRNNSRHSAQHSNQSNESVGIQSWNTEKSEPPRPENWKEIMKSHTPIEEEDPYCFDHNSNFTSTPILSGTNSFNGRARSHSPRKEKKEHNHEVKVASRSKSPQKKRAVSNTLDYLNSQCHLEGCSVALVVHTTRFLICRHQLCHASEYFKTMLLTHRRHEDIHVAVSGLNHPPPTTQFRWFVESCIPCPALKDIEDDTLETCMRLSRRFQASGLEVRCAKYIIENASSRQPIVALCWLNWCLKHKYDQQTVLSCLPCVARLSLASLEQHRHMMSERVFADILAAKLRGCYEKAVHVFRTIHRMDHFSVDLDRCPRCNRTREGMRIRVNADPCRKQIGCDRCHQAGCEIEHKAGDDLQAFYQCSHALLPLNDTTDECHCQTRSLAIHLGAAYSPRQFDISIPQEKTKLAERKSRSRQKLNSQSEN